MSVVEEPEGGTRLTTPTPSLTYTYCCLEDVVPGWRLVAVLKSCVWISSAAPCSSLLIEASGLSVLTNSRLGLTMLN